jgi:hypothetical protein
MDAITSGRLAKTSVDVKDWWARSDSTTRGKPLKRLRYREFEPRCCP